GARIPETPLAFPFAHNTMPVFGGNSYLTWIKLPYHRLPGFQSVKNNDVVVFNWPMEDFRPVDRRENYIKRCIGIAGDTLEIRNGIVFINGKQNETFPGEQDEYVITTDGTAVTEQTLNRLHISETFPYSETGKFDFHLTQSNIDSL